MTTSGETLDRAMNAAYGKFIPSSDARATRVENARRGLRTCWRCLQAFRPRVVRGADGRLHRPGRGRWYCSRSCAALARAEASGWSVAPASNDPDVLILDLRRCRGCAA